jgi:hypothetical protein
MAITKRNPLQPSALFSIFYMGTKAEAKIQRKKELGENG